MNYHHYLPLRNYLLEMKNQTLKKKVHAQNTFVFANDTDS